MNIDADHPRPQSPATDMSALLDAELDAAPKLVYVALLTADLMMVGIAGLLLLTEPATLPAVTRLLFAALLALGLVWAAFYGLVIARKRVLFSSHRVAAGWIALAGTALFAVAALVIATRLSGTLGRATVIATAITFLIVAIMNLRHAIRRHRSLLDRRDELQRRLAES